jgi:Lipocalin-like domain
MQKKILYIIILLFPAFVFPIACKKSSHDKTKAELIAQSPWKFDNAKVAGTDVSAFLDDCDKDNTVIFATNGTGTADEGATKCNAADPQTVSFTWEFQSNETILVASAPLFPGGNGTFTIITLTESQLIVSQDIDVSGTTQNAVITLKH